MKKAEPKWQPSDRRMLAQYLAELNGGTVSYHPVRSHVGGAIVNLLKLIGAGLALFALVFFWAACTR
jgi:hypothetical protein